MSETEKSSGSVPESEAVSSSDEWSWDSLASSGGSVGDESSAGSSGSSSGYCFWVIEELVVAPDGTSAEFIFSNEGTEPITITDISDGFGSEFIPLRPIVVNAGSFALIQMSAGPLGYVWGAEVSLVTSCGNGSFTIPS